MIQCNKRIILLKTAYNADSYLVSLSGIYLSIAVKVAVKFYNILIKPPIIRGYML